MKRRTEEILDIVDFQTLNRGAAGEPRDAGHADYMRVRPLRVVFGHIGSALAAVVRKLVGKRPDMWR